MNTLKPLTKNHLLKYFKAITFDLDGTLVDSKLNFDLMREEIGIPPHQPILEYLEAHTDPDFVQFALEVVHRHERAGAEQATLMPGVREFLDFLEVQRIPTGLLTRNSRVVTELTLERLNLSFHHVLTRDDCLPKPHPEGLHKLANVFELSPSELIYIGDFSFDIETARNAGSGSCLYGASDDAGPIRPDFILRDWRHLV